MVFTSAKVWPKLGTVQSTQQEAFIKASGGDVNQGLGLRSGQGGVNSGFDLSLTSFDAGAVLGGVLTGSRRFKRRSGQEGVQVTSSVR